MRGSASLTTWTTHLTTLEARAEEHDKFGNDLVNKVAEPLKHVGNRFEELRKRHVDFADKLEKERDGSYADLRKVKGKYDAACQEVESKRKKTESAFDMGKAKAQSAYQQQIHEMNNLKNTYLIAISVTNKQKEKYYHEYLPELMDSLQDLSEFRTIKLNALWSLAAQLETEMLQRAAGQVDRLAHEITRNQPHLDSMMFLSHNMGAFHEPPDKAFEPSPVWHDDDTMVTDDPARVYLRNVLNKSKSQLGDLRREVDKKRREVDAVKRTKQKIREGTEKKDEVLVVRQLFLMQEELHQVDRRRLTAEVETSSITAAVGDVTLGAKNHNFKSQTFKIPTNCDLCGERIWGLSAKGFDCRDCGYTCHSKCEMKVPAECPGEQSKEERKKLKQERQEAANALLKPKSPTGTAGRAELPDLTRSNTMTSLSSGYAASAKRSLAGPMSPTEEAAPPDLPPPGSRPPVASAPSTGPPKKNRVVAPPPAAYISELPGSTPTNGASGGGGGGGADQQRAKMMYAFEAGADGELSVPEGRDLVVLEPDGEALPTYHDPVNTLLIFFCAAGTGWIKVRAGFKEGLVPASYVELVAASSSPPPAALAPQNTGQSSLGRPGSTYSNSGSSIGGGAGTGTKKKGPAVAPRRGAKKLKYVEAVYEYAAQSEAEHSMAEGERFVLIREDQGDGWVEVEKGGVRGAVPGSYVQVV